MDGTKGASCLPIPFQSAGHNQPVFIQLAEQKKPRRCRENSEHIVHSAQKLTLFSPFERLRVWILSDNCFHLVLLSISPVRGQASSQATSTTSSPPCAKEADRTCKEWTGTYSGFRILVNFTAASNSQMNPTYRVIGIRKFAGYTTRLREENSPATATSIPIAITQRGRRREK